MRPTLISFLLDCSGSMAPMSTETVEAYNEFLRTQVCAAGYAEISLCLFDDGASFSPVRSLEEMPRLWTRAFRNRHGNMEYDWKLAVPEGHMEYMVRGGTAMASAVLEAIQRAEKHVKAQPGGAERVVVVVQTDGQDGDVYRHEMLAEAIAQKRLAGWEFLFLSAYREGHVAAKRLGFRPEHIITYVGGNSEKAFAAVSDAIREYRATGTFPLLTGAK